MPKPLFLFCVFTTLGFNACAGHANSGRYALTPCDNLRALQSSYDKDVAIIAAPPTGGVNALDRRGNSLSKKDYRTLSRSDRADIDSIRAAYSKNKCTDKTDRL